jgi:hypothetical protein
MLNRCHHAAEKQQAFVLLNETSVALKIPLKNAAVSKDGRV